MFMRPGMLKSWGPYTEDDLQHVPPIDVIKSVILGSETNPKIKPILIVDAKTGVGKTTDFVSMIFSLLSKSCMVFVPRVAIANSSPGYLCGDYKLKNYFGLSTDNLGFKTGDSSSIPTKTPNIIFGTHTLMEGMLGELLEETNTVVFIDEIHEISDSSAVPNAFSVIYEYLYGGVNRGFVILMSATPNIEYICKYFDLRPDSPNIVKLKDVTRFPITHKIIRTTSSTFKNSIIKTLNEVHPRNALLFSFLIPIMDASIGQYTVEDINRKKTQEDPNIISRKGKSISNILYKATQIGQAGITFVDLDLVMDDRLNKMTVIVPMLGMKVLITTIAPISTQIQRIGRVGRTDPGMAVSFEWEELGQMPSPVDAITYKNDIGSALSLSPDIFDVIRMIMQFESMSYQLPLAGIAESILHKIYLFGLQYIDLSSIRKLGSIGGQLRMSIESMILIPALMDSGMGFKHAAYTAAYFNRASNERNLLIEVISKYEKINGVKYITDLEYLIYSFDDLALASILYQEDQKTLLFISNIYNDFVELCMLFVTAFPSLYNIHADNKTIAQCLITFVKANSSIGQAIRCRSGADDEFDYMGVIHARSFIQADRLMMYSGTLSVWQKKYTITPILFIR